MKTTRKSELIMISPDEVKKVYESSFKPTKIRTNRSESIEQTAVKPNSRVKKENILKVRQSIDRKSKLAKQ